MENIAFGLLFTGLVLLVIVMTTSNFSPIDLDEDFRLHENDTIFLKILINGKPVYIKYSDMDSKQGVVFQNVKVEGDREWVLDGELYWKEANPKARLTNIKPDFLV